MFKKRMLISFLSVFIILFFCIELKDDNSYQTFLYNSIITPKDNLLQVSKPKIIKVYKKCSHVICSNFAKSNQKIEFVDNFCPNHFFVVLTDGKLEISKTSNIKKIIDHMTIDESFLSKNDLKLLKHGVYLENENDLLQFLEDFSL